MFKKYKIKKRKKAINIYFVFAVFVVLSICVSSGYALFSDTLTIQGTATFASSGGGGDEPSYELGNSTYSWKYISSWPNGDYYMYQVSLSFTNLDETVTDWVMSFDVPPGFLPDSSSLWDFSSVTLNGNTVTVMPTQNHHYATVNSGDTIDYYLQLAFETQVDFTMSNLVFNGKLATDVST